MIRFVWTGLLLAINISLCASSNIVCEFSTSNPIRGDVIPPAAKFPANYTVAVRYTNWDRNASSLIEELQYGGDVRIRKTSRQGITNVHIGKSNVTFNESTCAAFENVSSVPTTFELSQGVLAALNTSELSVRDLIDKIMIHNYTSYRIFGNSVVGGIETVDWVGCESTNASEAALQVIVKYAGEKSVEPYSQLIRNPAILAIDIVLFNVTNNSTLSRSTFDVTELNECSSADFSRFSVPPGTYCKNMTAAAVPSDLPDKFEASFDYTDVVGNAVHDVDMLYDATERVVAFKMNAVKDRDSPFIGNASLAADLTTINVIHDFKFGFEYILDGENNVCKSVAGINAQFGDVFYTEPATKEIDMKSASQILFNVSSTGFYYAGQRMSDEGAPLDVYVSEIVAVAPSQLRTVVEILYSSGTWTFDAAPAPFMHSVIQYHKNESGMEVARTVIRLHSFRNATEVGTKWNSLVVFPCLNVTIDSYLYVHIKNSSLTSLENVGLSRVESSLRETIAHTAGVSVIRVTKFFFKQIQENVVAFFVIGDISGKTPANTKGRMNETSVAEARGLLNQTLMHQDIAFNVVGKDFKKTELKLRQSSLGLIPTTWGPSPPPGPSFTGYTGGSMFVLAVFMLLLGAGIGVGGMFFMWKRQRLAGLAYQVFE